MEVRDLHGKPLPELSGDFNDPQLPIDHSDLAKLHLSIIRECGRLSAYSVHLFREGRRIGFWSLDGAHSDAHASGARPTQHRARLVLASG